jgi:hypothetical protein
LYCNKDGAFDDYLSFLANMDIKKLHAIEEAVQSIVLAAREKFQQEINSYVES